MGKDNEVVRNLKRESEKIKKDIIGKTKYSGDYTKDVKKVGNILYKKYLKENNGEIPKKELFKMYMDIIGKYEENNFNIEYKNTEDSDGNKYFYFPQALKEHMQVRDKIRPDKEYYLADDLYKKTPTEDYLDKIMVTIAKNTGGDDYVTYVVPKGTTLPRYTDKGTFYEISTPKARKEHGLTNKIKGFRIITDERIILSYIIKKEFQEIAGTNAFYYALAMQNLYNPKNQLFTEISDTFKKIGKYLLYRSENYKSTKRQLDYEKKILSFEKGSKVKTYENKENKNKKVIELTKDNEYLRSGLFRLVEFDDEIDVDKKLQLAMEDFKENIVKVPKPVTDKKPALRFRKLGHLKAKGVYFPMFYTIALDFRNLGAFVHEYGHYIDYTHQTSNRGDRVSLSLCEDFSPIVSRYTNIYNKLGSPYDKTLKYNDDYFLTPTEIFARAFEIYNLNNIQNSNLLESKGDYSSFEYKMFKDKELYLMINEYFDNLGLKK